MFRCGRRNRVSCSVSVSVSVSVQGNLGALDDFTKRARVAFDGLGEFSGRADVRLKPEGRQALLDLRGGQHLAYVGIDLLDGCLRRARRRQKAPPRLHFKPSPAPPFTPPPPAPPAPPTVGRPGRPASGWGAAGSINSPFLAGNIAPAVAAVPNA